MFLIFINSIGLAIYDYDDKNQTSVKNQYLDFIGNIFTIIFAVESVLEIIARGLILHPRAYLREGWCILDFVVVISG